MAASRKKITGKSKLVKAAESKKKPATQKEKEHLDLVAPSKKPTLKSYRLYDNDITRLKEITARMNKESHRKISETAAIRTLIAAGAHMSGEKLLKALRETI